MLKTLEGAHIGFTIEIAWMRPRREEEVWWVYPHLVDVLRSVGLKNIVTYIGRRQNTVTDWVATRPILDLCQKAEEPTEGGLPRQRW